jgi:type I restriction enzyme M protein
VISAPLYFKSSRAEIAEHGYVLIPGRYVGAEEVEDDDVPFADKMVTLTGELADQFAESARLEEAIRKNMQAFGFELPKASAK